VQPERGTGVDVNVGRYVNHGALVEVGDVAREWCATDENTEQHALINIPHETD
jgi:hypothetical protein